VAAAQQTGPWINRAEAARLERDATNAGFGVIAAKTRAIAREDLLATIPSPPLNPIHTPRP
jgi:hypothetical protein